MYQTSGAAKIFYERDRQKEAEHFTPQHDAKWTDGQLVQAAIAYCLATETDGVPIGGMAQNTEAFAWWPWSFEYWKPLGRISNLVRAGALIAAEIDRIQAEEGKL